MCVNILLYVMYRISNIEFINSSSAGDEVVSVGFTLILYDY